MNASPRELLPILAAAPELKALGIQAQATVEIHAAAEDGQPGQRPTVRLNAYSGGPMRLAYYWDPVVIDLAGLSAGDPVNLFADHRKTMDGMVGQADTVKITGRGVSVEGTITGDLDNPESPASLIVKHAQNGMKKFPVSVGVEPSRVENVAAGAKVKVNGRTFTGPLVVCRAGLLREVSFVGVGADAGASGSVAASATHGEGDTTMTFEQWLASKGWDAEAVEAMSEAQRATLEGAWQAEIEAAAEDQEGQDDGGREGAPPADPPIEGGGQGDPAADAMRRTRAVHAAEERRVAAVRKLCGARHSEICAQAIEQGWTAERTELAVMRAERPTAPQIIGGDGIRAGAPSRVATIEAAVCMAAGLGGLERCFQAPVLEAAASEFRGGLQLQELLLLSAQQGGYVGRPRITRSNVNQVIQAAFSTASLSAILSNVANKFLLEGFDSIEQVWRAIARIRTVNDLKESTAYRLLASGTFEKVSGDGMLKYGALSSENFGNKAETYGRMFGITRTDIINDDLNCLTGVPGDLGILGAKTLNLVFWTAFLDNAAFFTEALGNYASGAGTALSFSALSSAEAAFAVRKDPSGEHPLGITPTVLLVPPALRGTADALYKATEIRDTTASTKYPTVNTLAGRYRPESSAYLSDSGITGYSATAWYLLVGGPGAPIAVIEVVFLDGQQSPTIETVQPAGEFLGEAFRAFYDFGVRKQDYRAGLKRAGA